MTSAVENQPLSESIEPMRDADDRTMAVAIETQPILEAALAKKQLIDLQLLTAQEWDAAAEAAGTHHELVPILSQLQQMEASWESGSDEKFPVLTSYQAQKVVAGKPDELWLDHYVLLERLGSGGMGDVYKARNTRLPRLEAIKTIHTGHGTGGESITLGLERFQREAKLLTQLHHPHLTTIFHAGHDRDVQFIAIEYVRGKNLKQLIENLRKQSKELSVGKAVDCVITVAEVLAYAHKQGVIHRDIKPANIMMTDGGDLKVLDLGIAQLRTPKRSKSLESTRLTQGAVSLGTPEVMAPEQWADAQSVTAASDIYSLGCTLYYLLTGSMPFVSDKREDLLCTVVTAPRPNATEARADVPVELSAVIKKMLSQYPQDRYQSCEELITALLLFSDQAQTRSLPVTHEETSGLKRKVYALAAAAGIFGTAAVVATIGWQASSAQPEINKSQLEIARQLEAQRAAPFANLSTPLLGEGLSVEEKLWTAYDYESYQLMSEWFLQLQSNPAARFDNRLQVMSLVDGQPTTDVQMGQDATIRVRAEKRGYLSMLVFADNGVQHWIRWTEPVEPGQWRTAIEVPTDSVGSEDIVFFLTESDPGIILPAPTISTPPLAPSEDSEFLQGIITTRYTEGDLGHLRATFPNKAVYEEVQKHLKTGEPYPFAEQQPQTAKWWARQAFTLRVHDTTPTNTGRE